MWSTYLAFISIDYHSHPLHVDAILNNQFQASSQLFVERIEMLYGDRSNPDLQVDVRCVDARVKKDVRTVDGKYRSF